MNKFSFIVLTLIIFGCDSPRTSNYSATDSLSTSTQKSDSSVNIKPENEHESSWDYSADTNKMTSTVNYYATVNANDLLNFPFPYDGGSTATILIRHKEGENNVMLEISKGQFLYNPVDGCTIRIRFDKNKAESFSCDPPSDDSSTIIFISSANRFIKQCKKAKKVLIEAEFYQSGNKQMEFNVGGLKWIH